jgi:hypothetical protein
MLQHMDRRLRAPFPTLLIHADDASIRSLRKGDRVGVFLKARRYLSHNRDRRRHPGRSRLTTPRLGRPHVNRITSSNQKLDPLTGMPRLTGIAVTVEALTPPSRIGRAQAAAR